MKTLSLIPIFLGICLSVNSQIFDLNLSLGTSTFEEKTPEMDFLYLPSIAASMGVGVEIPLKDSFSIYSGIQLSVKQGSYTYKELGNNYEYKQNSLVSIVSTSIPLVLLYTLPIGKNRIQLGAGGFMGVNIFALQHYYWEYTLDGEDYSQVGSENLKFEDQAEANEEFSLRRVDLGLKASIAYKMESITLRVDSEYGLRNLSQFDNEIGQFLTRSLWLSVSAPIKFGK